MNVWTPTNLQFTVLRARNLIAKGKGGNNDVFVTIQLGKEKYQTSTIKNAHNPEWFEECDLPIPHLHTEIEVTVYHRGVLSDDFLGYATLPLWEQKLHDQPQTQWVKLKNKPGREAGGKGRGEIEVKVTFHCHSRGEPPTTGLKKRSSSWRNLALVVGDKLRFARSRSLRENRRDPEGGKTGDRNHHHASLHDIPEETLARSFSMTASCAGTMSLDRGNILTYPGPLSGQTGELRTQSLLNISASHHNMADLPSSQPPPPYQLRPSSSQDDMNSVGGSFPYSHPHPRRPVSFAPYMDSVLRRERARYESIRERTEPESSSTSDEGGEEEEDGRPRRRPRPPPRGLRARPRPRSEEVTLDSKDLGSLKPQQDQAVRSREGNSESGHTRLTETPPLPPSRCELITNGSLQVERERGRASSGQRPMSASSGELNVNGDVRLRKRTKRERLRMSRQGNRRFTVQGMEGRVGGGGGGGCGLYDDSLSESCTDTPIPHTTTTTDDLFTVYNNLTKEELLRVVIQNKAQLIRKDQYIRDLESYIDNLLVRVMETQPRILHRPPLLHPR